MEHIGITAYTEITTLAPPILRRVDSETFSGVRVAQSLTLCLRGVRVAQSLVFCVMVGRFLVGFVWLNLYFSVSWLVDF